MKVTHSSTDDLAICLPLEHQSDTVLQNQNIDCLLGQHHKQDNVSVQAVATEGNEDSHNQGSSKDSQTDKIKEYVLLKSTVLHQDNKTNQVSSTYIHLYTCIKLNYIPVARDLHILNLCMFNLQIMIRNIICPGNF